MRSRLFPVVLLYLFSQCTARAQEFLPRQPDSPQVAAVAPQNPPAVIQPQEEKHPRLFGIFPTHDISNLKEPVPLSTRAKFRLFVKETTDPYNLVDTAISAGLSQANNSLAGYGQGAEGYGKRLGAGLAYRTSGGFFGAFLFPTLFHQDPRYFRKGEGPFKDRLFHALIRPVVTRRDSGGNVFNWSGILARLATNGLSNAYYPAGDTGAGRVFSHTASQTAFSVTGTLFDEFGPDVERKILNKVHKSQPPHGTVPSPN